MSHQVKVGEEENPLQGAKPENCRVKPLEQDKDRHVSMACQRREPRNHKEKY